MFSDHADAGNKPGAALLFPHAGEECPDSSKCTLSFRGFTLGSEK